MGEPSKLYAPADKGAGEPPPAMGRPPIASPPRCRRRDLDPFLPFLTIIYTLSLENYINGLSN